jgi:hypothetical protein
MEPPGFRAQWEILIRADVGVASCGVGKSEVSFRTEEGLPVLTWDQARIVGGGPGMELIEGSIDGDAIVGVEWARE